MNKSLPAVPGDVLLQPVVLGSLGLWILNDHLFKLLWPGWLTGKLSDATGLVVCPLLLLAAFQVSFKQTAPHVQRAVLQAAVLVVGFGMVSIKTLTWAAFVYRWGLGALQWPAHAALATVTGLPLPQLRRVMLVMDRTDVWTLPSLIIPWWIGTSKGLIDTAGRRFAV